MPSSQKTFRVFVSSTFSDMRAERRILQKTVYPRLKTLCESKGASFQAVDLRWGVNEEAQLDHKTIDICLNEIARCQKLSPKPNFILLMGDRYGWQPVPSNIPSSEMIQILDQLTEENKDFVNEWYREDLNAIPAEYVLQPRGETHREYSAWVVVEGGLRGILRYAVDRLNFSEEQRIKYFASATHQEIIRGALNPPPNATSPAEHVFAYVRDIVNMPETVEAKDYIDLYDNTRDPYSKDQIRRLKAELGYKLPKDHIFKYPAKWNGLAEFDEEAFGARVYSNLVSVIEEELKEITSLDELDREKKIHDEFRKKLTQFFTGQEEPLQNIASYCEKGGSKVFAVIGDSGAGKTSMIAKAISDLYDGAPGLTTSDTVTVFRFVGITSTSSNLNNMLSQVCNEIANAYDIDIKSLLREGEDEMKLWTHEGLREIFLRCLHLATKDKPLLVFLDALDQFQSPRLDFLHVKMPKHARIVVSALPHLEDRLDFADIYKLPLMNVHDGDALLDKWLKFEKRKLTDKQKKEVTEKFKNNGLPIFLKLAFEQVRNWHSYDPPKTLPHDTEGIMSDYFDLLQKDHTEELVSKTIGYLLSGKYGGLSETEILDILVSDGEYWESFLNSCHEAHREEVGKIKKLPAVVWSRFYLDLEPYLTNKTAHGIPIITFYHRMFGDYARRRYLSDETDHNNTHKIIADYFEPRWREPYIRALDELPFHLAKSNQKQEFKDILCNIAFLDECCSQTYVYDLIRNYDLITFDNGDIIYQYRDFIRKHAQRLSKYKNILFSLCNHEGFADLKDKAISIINSKLWAKPWIRTETTIPFVYQPNEADLKMEVLSKYDFVVSSVTGLEANAGVGYILESIGTLRKIDVKSGQELDSVIYIRKLRPLKIGISADGDYIAVTFENGEIDVIKQEYDSSGNFVKQSDIVTVDCLLPEYADPEVLIANNELWFQNREAAIIKMDIKDKDCKQQIVKFEDKALSYELSGLIPVGDSMVILLRTKKDTIIISLNERYAESFMINIRDTDVACYSSCGKSRFAVVFTNLKLMVFDSTPAIECMSETIVKELPSCMVHYKDAILFVSSFGTFFYWVIASLDPPRSISSRDKMFIKARSMVNSQASIIYLITLSTTISFRLDFGKRDSEWEIFCLVNTDLGKDSCYAVGRDQTGLWLLDISLKMKLPLPTPKVNHMSLTNIRKDGVSKSSLLYAMDIINRVLFIAPENAFLVNLASYKIEQVPAFPPDKSLPTCIVSNPSGGFWMTDLTGSIYFITDDGQFSFVTKVSTDVVGYPKMRCWPNLLLWETTCYISMDDVGTELALRRDFFSPSSNCLKPELNHMGSQLHRVSDGRSLAVTYDLLNDKMIEVWENGNPRCQFLKLGTIKEFLDKKETQIELHGVDSGCTDAVLSKSGTHIFLLCETGNVFCINVHSAELLAVFSLSLHVTCLAQNYAFDLAFTAIEGNSNLMNCIVEGGFK